MKFEPEFIKAIQALPNSEKDKLILRLLKHDLTLANRLNFELLSTETVEDKRQVIEKKIETDLNRLSKNYHSPGYLLWDIKSMSGNINEHVSITKDKYGEIFLNCKMVLLVLSMFNNYISEDSYSKAYTFCIYVITKIFKILILIQKQHEDIHLEFKKDIEKIGEYVGQNKHLMRIAMDNGLDINWLINFEILNNISEIHKNIKAKGFLK